MIATESNRSNSLQQRRGDPLEGRTVFISGASSGLGAHFAAHLAGLGARVTLGARRGDLLEEACGKIERKGGRAAAVALDVTDEQSIHQAFDRAETAFGVVNSVIANAGIHIGASAMTMRTGDFDKVMSVNLRGCFLTAREGARRMVAAGCSEGQSGRVLIVASVMAETTWPGSVAYSASKAAVLHMGRILAREWVRLGINVNVLCPGIIPTDLNGGVAGDAGRKIIESLPRKRVMQPNDLDELVTYLVSDASRAVTGSVFTIDDGQSLR